MPISSSSSDSTMSSSSTSLDSSSSSGYCQYPSCEGNACVHLSGWYLENAKTNVVINNIIYVRAVYFPATNTQQIELYLDPTYFQLVAVGQVTSLVAVTILLDERSGSGITGFVNWDGVPLNFSYSGTLYCIDRSSSSSSSSIDSSSTSSDSTQSFSSSSSQCCTSVFCEGASCIHFTNWAFSGMGDRNTTNCSLFIGLDTSGSIQQVRIYKESTLINLVAIGQRSGLGPITFISQNNSGLTGSVDYDGTLIQHPNTLNISCNEFSSSSTSSSSSVDSSSSSSLGYTTTSDSNSTSSSTSSFDSSSTSSSEEYSESSRSSVSDSSDSSLTSNSTSSSSSFDSSSTSSESVGNFSSSSSSSGMFWNQAKSLKLGLTAPANISIKNRISQTFSIFTPSYDIGKAYCYLYKANGRIKSYSIIVSIWNCYDDGSPKDELFTTSILASTVVRDDWYSFEFNLTGQTTPSNGFLSISMRHDGDDDNYVLWGYDKKNDDAESLAWTSVDAINWQKYENGIMALRIVGDFNPVNTEDNILTTPPAEAPITIIDPIINEQINYSDAILSFVIDSSGSMGTTDRFNNRQSIVSCLIDKFKDNYPSEILFDVHTFGGGDIDVGGITGGLGRYATINLDLNNPDRTTYVFTVSGSDAKINDIYENDGNEFTVMQRLLVNQTLLIVQGNSDPIDSGTLNLVSGTGDSVIPYGSFKKVSTSDPMVAFGFKNLEKDHTYNIGSFSVDNNIITPVELENWQLLCKQTESPSVVLGANGPDASQSIDIGATTHLTSRKLFTSTKVYQSKMSSILYVGGSTVTVLDASGFKVNDLIDIIEGGTANMARTITGISGNTLTFSPVATLPITSYIFAGSLVQISTFNRTKSINGTTANLLVRDVDKTMNVVFYLQNYEGYYMEWDFTPFLEWTKFNIFFFGETAILPMDFFEKDGTPFPDGTKVSLSVNTKPSLLEANQVDSVSVAKTSLAGQTKIYLASTTGYVRGMIIDIIDKNGNVQTVEIEEIGEDSGGQYIQIDQPLLFDVSIEDGTTIKPNQTSSEQITPSNNILATEIPVVDVTTIVNDKDLSPSLLKPYDINRVPPSTPYEDLNVAKEFFQKEVLDMPTIDGNVCARILPIVEDILETVAEKEEDLNRLQRYSVDSDIVSQLEQNEGDEAQATETATTEVVVSSDLIDYVIQTPVYTVNGVATSSMQSFSQTYTEKQFDGITIPGIDSPTFFSKDYKIYAYADFLSESGRTSARLYLDPFDISFITPVTIANTYVEKEKTKYYLQDPSSEGCVKTYEEALVRGTYASKETTITLEYIIADKFILSNNKNLNITLYSNRIADLDSVAQSIVFGENENSSPKKTTEQFSNIRPFNNTKTVDGQTVNNSTTSIDQWRSIVANNPFEELINSVNETDNSPSSDTASSANVSDNIISQYATILNAALDNGPSAENSSLFYQDPSQWTLAKQYSKYKFVIPIINGKASIVIPKSDIVSLLMVEASVAFGNNNQHEQILNDIFLITNPVLITGISPSSISPVENERYEIGARIEYFGGTQEIEDNTQVNFTFSQTSDSFRVEPSSSVTNDGWAGGVIIGPLDPIEPQAANPAQDTICPPKTEITATVEVFHSSGYTKKSKRNITLSGTLLGNQKGDSFLFFAQDAQTALYADGNVNPNAKATVNLNDAINSTQVSSLGTPAWVGEDGVDRLQGFDQPNGLARAVTVFNASPRKSTWENNGILDMFALPLNKNIGFAPPLGEGERFEEPWSTQINAVTSYRQENGIFRRGEVANGLPFLVGLLGKKVTPKPIISYAEPLGITVGLETSFVRDGLTSSVILAELTWKGEPITNKFTINLGTEFESTIEYQFPKVTFESGICAKENASEGQVSVAIDNRNLISGCLLVSPHKDAILSDYSVTSGLFRSNVHIEYDISNNIVSKHVHVTSIDKNGNGTTTSTIVLFGTVADHTHIYTTYISDTQLGHSHTLRCVGITTLLPTTNIDTDFTINGTVIYDPTNCEPYGNEPNNPAGNRKMFSTARIQAGTSLPRKLVSKIELGNDLDNGSPIFVLDYQDSEDPSTPTTGSETTSATFYTAKSIDETIKGFDIRVFVKFAEYEYVDDIGNTIVVPEQIVPDGSRVTMEITAYKPQAEGGLTDPGFLVMGAGIERSYMLLKVKTAVTAEGYISERQFTIRVASIIQWYPRIRHEVSQLTRDTIYLDNALDSFGFFGSSQIHDAVKVAAEQLVQYQTDNAIYKDYKKFIVLITDGDENSSEISLNQAINSVSFVDGVGEIQIIPIQLGQAHASDAVLLEKYGEDGNSTVFYLNNSDSTKITEVCNGITGGNSLQINTTTLDGNITFEYPNIPNTTYITGVTAPLGSEMVYRLRTSVDGIIFSDYTDWIDYSDPYNHEISLGSLRKYVEYQIKITGNNDFETPTINGGVNISYFNPREFIIFFQPISVNLDDDEYISSIHITSEADIPTTSTVEYLMTQDDSLKPEEYYRIIPDQHTILPTRFNEILTTRDNKTFTAVNGRWNSNTSVQLFRIGVGENQGTIINPSEYALNSAEGTITFLSSQDPSLTTFMDVFFASSFRIATKITNFAENSAVIHHIGIMYNISKRVPRDNNGTIINVPIRRRLP